MPSYIPPKKNTAYIFYIGLPSQANSNIFQSNPTLASGDAKVSIDGGALANLATLPVVTPASSKMVKVSLSSSEMNGDNITLVLSDAAGNEWKDVIINIQTSNTQIDELPAAVLDSALTEPSGTFTWAGATLRNVLAWLGALSRNKMTQTGNTGTLRNDADNANISTSSTSDDGTTFTRGEWS